MGHGGGRAIGPLVGVGVVVAPIQPVAPAAHAPPPAAVPQPLAAAAQPVELNGGVPAVGAVAAVGGIAAHAPVVQLNEQVLAPAAAQVAPLGMAARGPNITADQLAVAVNNAVQKKGKKADKISASDVVSQVICRRIVRFRFVLFVKDPNTLRVLVLF